MRDDWNIKSMIEDNLSLFSQKFLLYSIHLFSLAFDKPKGLEGFIEKSLIPAFSFNNSVLKEIKEKADNHFELSEKLYDFLFPDEEVHPFTKLFLLDEEKLSDFPEAERQSFLKILIYLMLEDHEIDDQEQALLDLLGEYLKIEESQIDEMKKIGDVSAKEVEQGISTEWLKRFLIFIFLRSEPEGFEKKDRKKDFTRLRFVIQGMGLGEKILDRSFLGFDLIGFDLIASIAEYNTNMEASYSLIDSKDQGVQKRSDYKRKAALLVGKRLDKLLITTAAKDLANIFTNEIRVETELDYGMHDIKYIESNHLIICIDGFLTEGGRDQFEDWGNGLNFIKGEKWIAGYKWPSYNGSSAFRDFAQGGVTGLFDSSWYKAIDNAASASKRLIHEIQTYQRFKPSLKISLLGHSLGSRVIFNTLIKLNLLNHELPPNQQVKVAEVYLFGGAVSRSDRHGWSQAMQSVENSIFNFFSSKDMILTTVYQAAEMGEKPIGLGNIEFSRSRDFNLCELHNIDVSESISGHEEYKKNLPLLLGLKDYSFGISL